MTALTSELSALHRQILQESDNRRFHYQPRLARLIERMEASGERVPPNIRCLNEELVNDAIEAQFDNMPV